MIVKRGNGVSHDTVFKCDRCGETLVDKLDDRYKIRVFKAPRTYETIKNWDLCKKCYSMLCKGIDKNKPKGE